MLPQAQQIDVVVETPDSIQKRIREESSLNIQPETLLNKMAKLKEPLLPYLAE